MRCRSLGCEREPLPGKLFCHDCVSAWAPGDNNDDDSGDDLHCAHDDTVHRPGHYQAKNASAFGLECIDAITAAVSGCETPVEGFLTGNVIKYLWRWRSKGGVEDLRKARQYLNRLINHQSGVQSWEP